MLFFMGAIMEFSPKQVLSATLIVFAGLLAIFGISGWGWFLFAGLMVLA